MSTEFAAMLDEAWHLLVAGAAAIGIIMLPYIRIRAVVRENNAARKRAEDEEVQRALAWQKLIERITALEVWRKDHASQCHTEHEEIKSEIRRIAEDTAGRLGRIERAQGEITGRLDVLLRGMKPG